MKSKCCTGCNEEKFLEDFSKKSTGKLGRDSRCRVCISLRDKKYLEANREKVLTRRRKHYESHKESVKAAQKVYRQRPESKKSAQTRSKLWRGQNPEKVNLKNKVNSKSHYKNNKAYYIAKDAQRRAQKLQATPPWLTDEQKKQIINIYKARAKISERTGKEHHVDHIVPLQGENICGLHVPWNLAIIPKWMNLAKSNKF